MLYLNQSYNYLKRKRQVHFIEPIRHYYNNIFGLHKQHKFDCQKTLHYTLVKDVVEKYGKSWFSLDIPRTRIGGKLAINDKYLPIIEMYVAQNGLSQYSIMAGIKEVYSGPILTNDKTAIHPYELDIYMPELNLAVEFNSIKYHTIQVVGNAYYHIKKSIRCRKVGIRLIHVYEFEDYGTQIKLLQDLILGIDNYPKFDFNKNNLIGSIPKPDIVYSDSHHIIYGAGRLVIQ